MSHIRNLTILVVDDEPLTGNVLVRALEEDGYSATQTASSMECLQLLDKGVTFDLLIIDVFLPALHGFALGRMARLRNRNQKLLYISGAPSLIPEIERERADGPILGKPVRISELLESVRRVLASDVVPSGTGRREKVLQHKRNSPG
jgi:CheY-like chemotaxis protein